MITPEQVKAKTDERFWSKIKFAGLNDCWEWQASFAQFGYGQFNIRNKMSRAHRFIYLALFGELPKGICVLHRCDNPPCVNPNHLFTGTKKENTHDMIAKGRLKFVPHIGSKNGFAKLNEEKVRDIKMRLARRETHQSIADHYGTAKGTIGFISIGETWGHVK